MRLTSRRGLQGNSRTKSPNSPAMRNGRPSSVCEVSASLSEAPLTVSITNTILLPWTTPSPTPPPPATAIARPAAYGGVMTCNAIANARRVFLTAWDNVSATEKRDAEETRITQVGAPSASRAPPGGQGARRRSVHLEAFPKLGPRGYPSLATCLGKTWHGN
jgi:hypothetical protein